MSAFGGKAVITETFENVCFLAQSGHKQVRSVAVQTDPETHSATRSSLPPLSSLRHRHSRSIHHDYVELMVDRAAPG